MFTVLFMSCWNRDCVGVKGKRGRDERRLRKTAVGADCVQVCAAVQCLLIHRKKNDILK